MCIFILPPHCPFSNQTHSRIHTLDGLRQDLSTDLIELQLYKHISNLLLDPGITYIKFCCEYHQHFSRNPSAHEPGSGKSASIWRLMCILVMHDSVTNPFLCVNRGFGGIQVRHRSNDDDELSEFDDCEVCTELARSWQRSEIEQLQYGLDDGNSFQRGKIGHGKISKPKDTSIPTQIDSLYAIIRLNEQKSQDHRFFTTISDLRDVGKDRSAENAAKEKENIDRIFSSTTVTSKHGIREMVPYSLTSTKTVTEHPTVYRDPSWVHVRLHELDRKASEMVHCPHGQHQQVNESVCACVKGKEVDKLCGSTREVDLSELRAR